MFAFAVFFQMTWKKGLNRIAKIEELSLGELKMTCGVFVLGQCQLRLEGMIYVFCAPPSTDRWP